MPNMKKELLFLNEDLLEFMKENNYGLITDSPSICSFIYNNSNISTRLELINNKMIYLKFKKFVNNKIYSDYNMYINKINEFLDIVELNPIIMFTEGENKIKKNINKKEYSSKLTKIANKKFCRESIVYLNTKNIINFFIKLLDMIESKIINENLSKNIKFRIIVEFEENYNILCDYIFNQNLNIKFKKYHYLFESECYKRLINYILKDERYSKDKIKRLVSDFLKENKNYEENAFINFMKETIYNSESNEQLLFYLYFAKNLYNFDTFNNDSKIEIVLLSKLEKEKNTFDYVILENALTYKSNYMIKFDFEKIKYILKNFEIYQLNSIKNPSEDYINNFYNLMLNDE